jgi:hypothetical protein
MGANRRHDTCTTLEFITDGTRFRPIELQEGNGNLRPLGVFETPISGLAAEDSLYAFFSLRTPPSARCPRPEGCALGDDDVPSGGRAILARSTDGVSFFKISDVSTGKFQWPVAIVRNIRTIPGLIEPAGLLDFTGDVAVIFASGRKENRFRRGYPFLAVAPLPQISDMHQWRYFTGLRNGRPVFVRANQDAAAPLPPFGHEKVPGAGQPPYHRCVGELSAGYIEPWGKWAMLYACADSSNDGYNKDNVRGIYLRTADVPWGPWSAPTLIFRPSQGYCRFMHSVSPCPPDLPNPMDRGMQVNGVVSWGGEYAPILLPTYTNVQGESTDLYFLMSTWNPYQVVLMRTHLSPPSSYGTRVVMSSEVYSAGNDLSRELFSAELRHGLCYAGGRIAGAG